MTVLTVVAAAIGGAVVGWWLALRRAAVPVGSAVTPHLLPDPALDWLRRAHGALGVWVAELDAEDGGPRAERIVDAERLSVAEIVAVDRRLERARDGEESGAEQLGGHLLVFHAAAGTAAGLLLPGGAVPETSRATDDLRRLVEGVRRKPQVIALAQAGTRDASLESAASVGLRLAYQIERILGERGLAAEVAVVAMEPGGVRVIGVSGRADRRLLDRVVPLDSALGRAVAGAADAAQAKDAESGVAIGDAPFGSVIDDRRQRSGAAVAFPMCAGPQPVGAAVVWLAGGRELTAPVCTELREALADAAPRLVRAADVERHDHGAINDPLTGLYNRRGFEELLGRPDAGPGSVVVGDLDRLGLLNDSLGRMAGDAALVHVAHVIRDQMRAGDAAARIGGGKFVLWLPGVSANVGVKVAERVRIRLGATAWHWQGRAWPLSASFGVAPHHGPRQDIGVALERADVALQVAKQSGRSRVETAADAI